MKNQTIPKFLLLLFLATPQLSYANHGALNGIGTLITMLFIALAIFIGLLLYPLFIHYRASKNKASYSSIVLGIWISYFLLAISIVILFMGGVPAIISLLLSMYSIRQLHNDKNALAPQRDNTLLDDI